MSRIFPLFFSILCISSITLVQRPSYKAEFIVSSSLYYQCYLYIYVPQISKEEKKLNHCWKLLQLCPLLTCLLFYSGCSYDSQKSVC